MHQDVTTIKINLFLFLSPPLSLSLFLITTGCGQRSDRPQRGNHHELGIATLLSMICLSIT